MSRLSKLQGKGKVFKIGDLELEIKPLTLDDMSLFNVNENSSPSEQLKTTKELVSKTLKESVPDATDEEISAIGMQYMTPLVEAIMEVNGLSEQKKGISAVKDRINAIRQAQQDKAASQ